MGVWLCLLVHSVALAGGPLDWSSTYDARLSQAMGADPAEAIAVYETLVAQMSPEDAQRGDVLYWLGRARWSAGDLAGARRSLESAGEYPEAFARVRVLMSIMDAGAKAVSIVPSHFYFKASTDPWVRGWQRGQPKDLSVVDGPDGFSVRWATEVVDADSDFVIFGLSTDGQKVSTVSLRLRPENLQGRYRFLVEDEDGQRWTTSVQSVPTDRWVDVVLPVSRFVRADAPAVRGAPNAARLKWFILRDVTALYTDQRGENALLIASLVVQ